MIPCLQLEAFFPLIQSSKKNTSYKNLISSKQMESTDSSTCERIIIISLHHSLDLDKPKRLYNLNTSSSKNRQHRIWFLVVKVGTIRDIWAYNYCVQWAIVKWSHTRENQGQRVESRCLGDRVGICRNIFSRPSLWCEWSPSKILSSALTGSGWGSQAIVCMYVSISRGSPHGRAERGFPGSTSHPSE